MGAYLLPVMISSLLPAGDRQKQCRSCSLPAPDSALAVFGGLPFHLCGY